SLNGSFGAGSVSPFALDHLIAPPITTRTVTNLSNYGSGSFREAVLAALAGDTINFAVTGTITLSLGEIAIHRSIHITGPGARLLTIGGGGAQRVFNVSGGTTTISNLTIRDG